MRWKKVSPGNAHSPRINRPPHHPRSGSVRRDLQHHGQLQNLPTRLVTGAMRRRPNDHRYPRPNSGHSASGIEHGTQVTHVPIKGHPRACRRNRHSERRTGRRHSLAPQWRRRRQVGTTGPTPDAHASPVKLTTPASVALTQ